MCCRVSDFIFLRFCGFLFFFVTKQTIEMKINKNNHKINEQNVNHNRFRGVEGEVMILRVFSHD